MKKNLKNKLTIGSIQLATLLSIVNCRLVVAILVVAFAVACSSKKSAENADTYTCPMHPTVISDKPGTCPVCGMDLVKKARPGEEVEITEDLSKLLKSPSETVIASITTIKGEYKSLLVTTEAQGIVTYDTRNIYTIPARIGGRLEKVYLKYAFQQVQKGQKVAEIYSPELLTAQREFIFLLENDPNNQSIIQGARERLKLLGATDAQINELIQSKEPKNTFAIYSPYEGYIISETQLTPVAPLTAQSGSGGMGDMGGTSKTPSSGTPQGSVIKPNEPIIREGSYVSTGQTLFKVVNPSALRVELNIATQLAGKVKKGDKVMLEFGEEHGDTGSIDFIQPFFSEGQEFQTVRVYTKNTDRLHIGHLVKATLENTAVEALWVPKEAVLDLGVEDVVFIKEKNVLKPKKVIIGTRSGNQIEIKQGLSSSDEIAANAQYLVDSESFIKTNK